MKPQVRVEQLDDDMYRLGSRGVPVYLLRTAADCWVLIEGGVSVDAELVWAQLCQMLRSPADISDWLLTHRHYDHCGLLPLLLPRLPQVRCHAPVAMKESLTSMETCRVIAGLNARLATAAQRMPIAEDWQCLSLAALSAGDCLKLGDAHQLRVLKAPGHSDDLVVYYDEERKRLFASDALGEFDPATGLWRPLAFHDYGAYLDTLKCLQSLVVSDVLGGHERIMHEAAQQAVTGALEGCLQLEHEVSEAGGSAEEVNALVYSLHLRWGDQSAPFVPKDLHLASMRRLVQRVQQYLHSSRGKHVH